MISSLPKFRSDLTVVKHETARETSFVVKDPVSSQFFRFGEAERFIAQQCDGETPLDAVRRRTEERFSAELPAETFIAFIRNLGKAGLLESEETKQQGDGQKQRIRGGLLRFRFKVFDPTRLFDRLDRRVRFFFTPHFMVFSGALILLAAGITIANWSEFIEDLPRLYRLSAIPLFMAVIFSVIALHEFAHGLTCKRFGGEVHEIGFMLIYLSPALYCNVSDAWLFPEKSKRLWVGFAGPYFELFLWALSVFAWRVTDVETWINFLALIVMTSSGIKTFLNFNPFIKLDGYYLLSDYLEIPNLRKRSVRHVGDQIKRLFGLEVEAAEQVGRRERKIYFFYGLTATVTTFTLLAYIILTAGGVLIEGREPTAVLLSTGFLSLKLRRKFRKLFGKGEDPDEDDGDDLEPENAAGPPEPAEPGTKTSRNWKRRITWTALTAASLPVLFFGHLELRIGGPFNVLPVENADVRAEVDGIIEQIYVDEGDKVKAGDLIARLSDDVQRSELQKIESDLAAKRARLKMLVEGPRAEEIALARTAVETGGAKHQQALALYAQAKRERDERLALTEITIKKAEERLQFAGKNLEMYQTLVQQGLGSRMQLDEAADQLSVRKRELEEARAQKQVLLAEDLAEARTNVSVTEKALKEAEGRLQVLLAGTRREEIQALEAEINSSEAQQAYLREQLHDTRIVSPVTGIVATPSRQLKEMKRQLVKQGDLIAKVYDFKTVTAQIVISEKEIAGIEVGRNVAVKTRAYPDQTFYGTVTSISTSAQSSSSSGSSSQNTSGTNSASSAAIANKTILVTTEIDNSSLLLKPEMTGQAKIFCGQRRIIDLITRRVARTVKVEFWSWW